MMLLLFVYSADHPEIKLVVAATCDTRTGGDGREKGRQKNRGRGSSGRREGDEGLRKRSKIRKGHSGTNTINFQFIFLIIPFFMHLSGVFFFLFGFHLSLGYFIVLFPLSSSRSFHFKGKPDAIRVMPLTTEPSYSGMEWFPCIEYYACLLTMLGVLCLRLSQFVLFFLLVPQSLFSDTHAEFACHTAGDNAYVIVNSQD